MNNNITSISLRLGGEEFHLEVGRFASRTNASVVARYGETEVLATVVAAKPREDINYFPLFVEYKEKYYAGGIISPSRFVKRERRPSDENVLSARAIDRSIRPLFPDTFKNEVQVICTVLSYDGVNEPDVVAAVATSAALSVSDIPWNGPVGMVRVGKNDGEFVINPTSKQRETGKLDLMVTSTHERVLMLEAQAHELPEDEFLSAVKQAHETNQEIIEAINGLVQEVGKDKMPVVKPDVAPEVAEAVNQYPQEKIDEAVQAAVELEDSDDILDELAREIHESLGESHSKSSIARLVQKRFKARVREMIMSGERPDGRGRDEIRELDIQTGVLARTHGSALFRRGATEVLSVITLGPPSLEQWLEGMTGEETKRYMHHYYAPPYCFGDTGRLGYPSRREVGHGSLAERALEPMVPNEEDFPYTIRVVSEVMTSNGSTSMASVCGSTLALMEGGVPIEKPVAGIALGMVEEDDKQLIFTDLIGLEDFNGDMDFKVAGTRDGITAVQVDVKNTGLTFEMIKEALEQARDARMRILDEMMKVIAEPRPTVSERAPKIHVIHIDTDMIGEVIGPGGRMVREIIAQTGATVDVNDDGRVVIAADDSEGADQAKKWVEDLTSTVEPGDKFTGTVERIEPYGVFVKFAHGKEGLVHVSEMASHYVDDPKEMVSIGDMVEVWIKGFNDRGQISLTMMSEDEREKSDERNSGSNPGGGPKGNVGGTGKSGGRGSQRGGSDSYGKGDSKRSNKDHSSKKKSGARDHFREAME